MKILSHDNAMQQYGVEVSKIMAYWAKNIALDVVLGDHREQYCRLRDCIVIESLKLNPDSRTILELVGPMCLQAPAATSTAFLCSYIGSIWCFHSFTFLLLPVDSVLWEQNDGVRRWRLQHAAHM